MSTAGLDGAGKEEEGDGGFVWAVAVAVYAVVALPGRTWVSGVDYVAAWQAAGEEQSGEDDGDGSGRVSDAGCGGGVGGPAGDGA